MYRESRYPFEGWLYCRYPDWGYPVLGQRYPPFRGYSLEAYLLKNKVIRRLVRLEEARSLLVTFIVKVVSEKVFHLARINVPLWPLDRIPIMGIRLFYPTISVQTDSVNMECVSSMVTKLCAMTQLLPAWKIKYLKYTVFHRSPVRRWFLVGNRCVLIGTIVIQGYLR